MDTDHRRPRRQTDIPRRRPQVNIKHTILEPQQCHQCHRNHNTRRDRTRERGVDSLILDPNAWILDQARRPNIRIRGTWVDRCLLPLSIPMGQDLDRWRDLMDHQLIQSLPHLTISTTLLRLPRVVSLTMLDRT